MVRQVNTYSLTGPELLTLSVLNPAAAGLLGWGVNVLITWCQMPETNATRPMLGWACLGLFLGGGVLQLISWGMLAKVWLESHDETDV